MKKIKRFIGEISLNIKLSLLILKLKIEKVFSKKRRKY